MDEVERKDSGRTGGATFGYARRQAGSGVPGPGGVMSCSEVMYQYYPYLYQRPPPPPPPHPTHPHTAPHTHPHTNPHAAHDSPTRSASFQSFSAATATHQYDRVSSIYLPYFRFLSNVSRCIVFHILPRFLRVRYLVILYAETNTLSYVSIRDGS